MSLELYKKHRPKLLKQVLGQDAAVSSLSQMLRTGKLPHTMLFSGPSGCGKTTLARILQAKLDCSDHDFSEINTADFRGIEMVRDIRSRMGLAPMGGKTRIWLIDEAHQMSSAAQNAFLKILEDTPNHVYFFIATTDPQKLIPTIRNRCTHVALSPLQPDVMEKLIRTVSAKEKFSVSEDVVDALVEAAEGSARRALVMLHHVSEMKTVQEQLSVITNVEAKEQGIAVARELFKASPSWGTIAAILKKLDDDPETVRWTVLGYARTILLSGNKKLMPIAYRVIYCFRDNFYDSKAAGLAAACFEVVHNVEG